MDTCLLDIDGGGNRRTGPRGDGKGRRKGAGKDMNDIFERLRERLDSMATGYPKTASGVETRILRRLFGEEDARVFLAMGDAPEDPVSLAGRMRLEPRDMAVRLEDMARRGLVFRMKRGGQTLYLAVPFVVGIYEFQLNNLDPELLGDISEYYLSGLGASFHSLRTPHLRTIPIDTRIASGGPVAPYDDARAIVGSKTKIALAECFCRKAVRVYGKTCSHPMETCMQFDAFAEYYLDNRMARPVSKDEAMAVLDMCEEEGLVIHPVNSKSVEAMCACCSCCCGMLLSLKLFAAPALQAKSTYTCAFDPSLCTSCGACGSRCPVGALRFKDGAVRLRPERCIGCGLCVSRCPAGALTLKKKDRGIEPPPETVFDTFALMRGERVDGNEGQEGE